MVTEDALKIGNMHQITVVGLILIELFLVENMCPTVRFRPSWAPGEKALENYAMPPILGRRTILLALLFNSFS